MPANPDRKMITIRLGGETLTKLNALCGNKTKATGLVVHRSEMITELVVAAHADVFARRKPRPPEVNCVAPGRELVIIRLLAETITKLNALCGDKAKATGLVVHRSEMVGDLIQRAHAEVFARRKRAG